MQAEDKEEDNVAMKAKFKFCSLSEDGSVYNYTIYILPPIYIGGI